MFAKFHYSFTLQLFLFLACDVMTPSFMNSPQESYQTTESVLREHLDESLEEIPAVEYEGIFRLYASIMGPHRYYDRFSAY